MRRITQKLRSRSGATMLIAMVFMMFCAFVGGSVLVAATANAYRVAQMAEQQDFLCERSAALLLSDQVQLNTGEQFRLHVVDAMVTTKEVNVIDGGGVEETGNQETERVITFHLVTNIRPADMDTMQKLMAQTTVWRYLRENAAGTAYKVEVIGFPGVDDLSDFLYVYEDASISGGKVTISNTSNSEVKGSFAVSTRMSSTDAPEGITEIPGYTAYFSSGKGEELYDFHVDFGETGQLMLSVGAFQGSSPEITVVSPAQDGQLTNQPAGTTPTGFVQVTTRSTQTIISWDDPRIEKGEAEA